MMTNEFTIYGNKLIAEFVSENNNFNFVDDDGYYWIFEGKEGKPIEDWVDYGDGCPTKFKDCFDVNLLYHESYDWLIPVINKVCDKIEELLDSNSITSAQEKDLMGFYDYFDNVSMFNLEIKDLYLQVISFINWDNSNEIRI